MKPVRSWSNKGSNLSLGLLPWQQILWTQQEKQRPQRHQQRPQRHTTTPVDTTTPTPLLSRVLHGSDPRKAGEEFSVATMMSVIHQAHNVSTPRAALPNAIFIGRGGVLGCSPIWTISAKHYNTPYFTGQNAFLATSSFSTHAAKIMEQCIFVGRGGVLECLLADANIPTPAFYGSKRVF